MREYVVNRPEEAAMRRLLEREQTGPEAMILRLAWLEGLTPDEMAGLRWEQVSFLDDRLELPDRMVPLAPELRPWLWRTHEARAAKSPWVVSSDRSDGPLRPESISRLARQALDRGGLGSVRLMDLRHDWIIRLLAEIVQRGGGVTIGTCDQQRIQLNLGRGHGQNFYDIFLIGILLHGWVAADTRPLGHGGAKDEPIQQRRDQCFFGHFYRLLDPHIIK